jgi:hypothetical protein
MPNIIFWEDIISFTSDDIIVVRKKYLSLLNEFIKEQGIPGPRKCYLLSDTVDESEIGIFLHYAEIVNRCYDYEIIFAKKNTSVESFFTEWANLISRINNLDYLTAQFVLQSIQKINIPFFSNADNLLRALDKYVNDILLPMIHDYPYHHIPFDKKCCLWHSHPLKLIRKYSDFQEMINGLPIDEISRNNIQKYIKKLISFWSRFIEKKKEDKFYMFSAYLYFLAKYYHDHSFHNLSLIMVHRSLDLYFQCMALSEGMMIECDGVLKYDKPHDDDMISLMKTEYILHRNGILTGNKDRRRFLSWLNTSRNYSIFTHYVYSINENDSIKAIITSEKVIRDIEGSSRWIRHVEELIPTNIFSKELLFLSEPSFDTFCREELIST